MDKTIFFSKLNDRRLALKQLFSLVNITLISFIDSECIGLVTLKLVSPGNKIS